MRHFRVGMLALALVVPGTALAQQQLAFSPETFSILGGMQSDSAARPKAGKAGSKNAQAMVQTRLQREIVSFDRDLPPGSILVKTKDRELYFVLPDGKAILYPVGVGRDGFTWSGSNRVSRKAEWPDWRPPPKMIRREREKGKIIPVFMAGGPDNPLGARALYIGSTEFRIHGTTQPWSIGRGVSSGCIRMLNEHVIDLYDRVEVGARVVVE